MEQGNLLLLNGNQILSLLTGLESEIIDRVRQAYVAHANRDDSLPHSSFLRFPNDQRNRIIALPAYLGGGFQVAGIKWVSSFPGNHIEGIDRASAVTILNSTSTGRAEAILEGSVISAKRTASSAALAAQVLRIGREPSRIGIIGCGLINFEITRFLLSVFPGVRRITLFDLDSQSAERFKEKGLKDFPDLEIEIARKREDLFVSCELISFATTAITPHVYDLSMCRPDTTIIHISLRDLSPEIILASVNVVDDADHVCRADTSIHLAEKLVGNRSFISSEIGEILMGKKEPVQSGSRITIFSPFGLGILDLAVSKLVFELAVTNGIGQVISSFFPAPWTDWISAKIN